MGAVIGTIIFIALVYNIIMSLKPSVENKAIELLEKSYKALGNKSNIVKKLPNGFMWRTNEYSGLEGRFMDIYITVEEKRNMDSVFIRTAYDKKYGFFFRYVYELSEEEYTMMKEHVKTNTFNLNKYASMCNPAVTPPFITKLKEKDNKKILECSHFALLNDEDIDVIKRKFKELGEAEGIKALAFGIFNSYCDFIDEYFEHIPR